MPSLPSRGGGAELIVEDVRLAPASGDRDEDHRAYDDSNDGEDAASPEHRAPILPLPLALVNKLKALSSRASPRAVARRSPSGPCASARAGPARSGSGRTGSSGS